MPTERLSELPAWHAARPAIPGWVWSMYTSDLPAEDPGRPLNVPGIVEGLGALLTAMGVMGPVGLD